MGPAHGVHLSVQVPSWLLKIVERGLEPNPDDRYPSMAELLHALGHDPAQARRRWAWVGGGSLLVAGAVGLQLLTLPNENPCLDARSLAELLWGDERRATVRAALLDSKQAYALETAERVDTQIEIYAKEWATGHMDACEATRVRDEQSAEAFDLRMACLRRHRAELDATVETLAAKVSDRTLMQATGMIAALPPVTQCADVEALRARGRVRDPSVAAELEEQEEQLARANALQRAGRSDDARVLARKIEERAARWGDPILHGETMMLQATLSVDARDTSEATRWYRLAYADGVEGRHAPLVIDASMGLAHWLGVLHGRTQEAEQWLLPARAWLRGRDEDDPLRPKLLLLEGELAQVAGRVDEARTSFERAVDLLEHSATGTELASAHKTLGLALMALGDTAAAEPHFMRLLELRRELLGPHHPSVGQAHQNLGATRYMDGKLAPALPHLEQALEIYENAYGPDHPKVASVLGNLGAVRDDLGEHEEARELFERALTILESADESGTTMLVGLLGNLAGSLQNSGDYVTAAVHLRRAASLVETAHGPAHPEHIALLTNLGRVLIHAEQPSLALEILEQANELRHRLPAEASLVSADAARALGRALGDRGEHSRALALLGEAIVLYRELGEALDPRRGETLLDLGELRLEADDIMAAVAALEDAIPLLAQRQAEQIPLARARFALARALVARGSPLDRQRARSLGADALLGLGDDDPLRPRIRKWLNKGPIAPPR